MRDIYTEFWSENINVGVTWETILKEIQNVDVDWIELAEGRIE